MLTGVTDGVESGGLCATVAVIGITVEEDTTVGMGCIVAMVRGLYAGIVAIGVGAGLGTGVSFGCMSPVSTDGEMAVA